MVTFAGLELNEAEQKLVDAAQKGEICDLRTGDEEADKPANGDSWGEDRTVRAEVIRRLCVGAYPGVKVDYRGVRLVGARVTSELNLSEAQLDFPLWLEFCRLEEPVLLGNARVRTLLFDGSWMSGILANGMVVSGNFYATGTHVSAFDISDEDSFAVQADGAEFGGGVFLNDNFEAVGEVRLLKAKIAANLECGGAAFTGNGRGGDALTMDGLEVGGSIFIGDGFSADGAVRLVRAKIEGSLSCTDGVFGSGSKTGAAFVADGIRVGGSVFLRGGFEAEGEVRLPGAMIGGQLECSDGRFAGNGDGGRAFTASGVDIEGDVFLSRGFRADGEVWLLGAKISGQLNCSGGKFGSGGAGRNALSADRTQIEGSVFLDDGFEADGSVRLAGAKIGGQLSCVGGGFKSAGGFTLNLQNAEIGEAFIWKSLRSEVVGDVNLESASVGVLIDDEASWPAEDHRLILDGFEYGRLAGAAPLEVEKRLKWLGKQRQERGEVGFKPQPYEQLAAVYDRMGHDEDARKVRIAKRQAERKWGKLSKSRWLQNWFLDKTIKYGWRPWRAVWIGLAIVAFGFGVFSWAGSEGGMQATGTEDWFWVQALVYSLDAFLPVVDLGPEGKFGPNQIAGAWGWIAQVYLWVHILLGWIVTSLGVLAFSGLVRQK